MIVRLLFATFCLAICLLGGLTEAHAHGPHRPGPKLLARLAEEPAFRHLLHYRASVLGGVESEIDDATFFLAPRGKTDPLAELTALVDAVFSSTPGEEDVRCRFPARVAWLAEQFRLPEAEPGCHDLAKFQKDLATESVSLVYAANSLRHPASAIGHSFLLLRPRAGDALDIHGKPVGTTIDYLAKTDTKNPLAYAYKGLTGQFVGRFEILPQSEKFTSLLDREDRDLWEFQLALTPAELGRFTLHLYELARTRIHYFYLTENCSYQALRALEAAAPRLHLTDRTKFVVLPLDTVRAAHAESGLIGAARYFPARSTRARDASTDGTSPSTASDPAPRERNPALAHGPLRFGVTSGFSSTKQAFLGASFRLVLHDFLDAPVGFPELLQVQLAGLAARYAPATNSFTIDRVTFVDLFSLHPLDESFPLSFRVRALGDRVRDDACPSGDCFVHGLDLGLGLTWATRNRALAVFLLATTSTVFSDDLAGVGATFVRLGVGPELGLRARFGSETVGLVTTRLVALPWQTLDLAYDVEAGLRTRLHRDVALGVEARAQPRAVEGTLSSYFYF